MLKVKLGLQKINKISFETTFKLRGYLQMMLKASIIIFKVIIEVRLENKSLRLR